MKTLITAAVLCLIILMPARSQNLINNPGFEINEEGSGNWTIFYPREEISPVFRFDNTVSHSGKRSAMLQSAGSKGTYGGWTVRVKGIDAPKRLFEKLTTMQDTGFLSNQSYLVSCFYRTKDLDYEKNVRIKLTWTDRNGEELFTEFVRGTRREGEWIHAAELKRAPFNATGIVLNLLLQWTDRGSVWFDDISFEAAPTPANRSVTVAASAQRPKPGSTTERNLSFYTDIVARAGKAGADIVCLGEGITVVATTNTYVKASEPVPGTTSKIIGEAARKAGIYVIAGIYEREGDIVYNTALLFDRQGNIAGKYRKTHLPQAEVEGGLTPGNEYPVFKTDFGNIGIEICYDNFFPDVARNLMLNGAEIIFCPIWGDIRGFGYQWDVVARARAIDNSVHFVASMYDINGSIIIDPEGKILSRADGTKDLIISKIYPDKRTFERWLSMKSYGEWKNLFPNEWNTNDTDAIDFH